MSVGLKSDQVSESFSSPDLFIGAAKVSKHGVDSDTDVEYDAARENATGLRHQGTS